MCVDVYVDVCVDRMLAREGGSLRGVVLTPPPRGGVLRQLRWSRAICIQIATPLWCKKRRPTDGATRLMTPQLRRTGVMKQGAQPMEPRHLHCNCDTDLMQKRGSTDGATRLMTPQLRTTGVIEQGV